MSLSHIRPKRLTAESYAHRVAATTRKLRAEVRARKRVARLTPRESIAAEARQERISR